MSRPVSRMEALALHCVLDLALPVLESTSASAATSESTTATGTRPPFSESFVARITALIHERIYPCFGVLCSLSSLLAVAWSVRACCADHARYCEHPCAPPLHPPGARMADHATERIDGNRNGSCTDRSMELSNPHNIDQQRYGEDRPAPPTKPRMRPITPPAVSAARMVAVSMITSGQRASVPRHDAEDVRDYAPARDPCEHQPGADERRQTEEGGRDEQAE